MGRDVIGATILRTSIDIYYKEVGLGFSLDLREIRQRGKNDLVLPKNRRFGTGFSLDLREIRQ